MHHRLERRLEKIERAVPPRPDPAFEAAVDEFIRQALGLSLGELSVEELLRLTEFVEAVQAGAREVDEGELRRAVFGTGRR